MAASATTQHSPACASFAGLLERFATQDSVTDNSRAWNDSSGESDIASLSYDQALRIHARPEPAKTACMVSEALTASAAPAQPSAAATEPLDERRKSASVTIRLSQSELSLLHTRAVESGLNVSAYLRSCIFEVEDLRAQVKRALIEMRAPAQKPAIERQPHWFNQLFAGRYALRRSNQA